MIKSSVIFKVGCIILTIGLLACKNEQKPDALKPAELYHFSRNYPEYDKSSLDLVKELGKISKNKTLKNNTESATQWVTQGPYNHGGRINTIAHNPGNDKIIYVGGSNGGIFKTTDGGENWKPIFDDHAYLAIGHILVSPHDTNTIYVGTGDPNISGYPWIGNGVYKSTDAGATWEHLGLDSMGIVTKVAVNYNDPKILYAATMGVPFIRNKNRGLYKSTNGGVSWQQVLFLNNDAGIIDLLMIPNSPDTLFAAGWNRIRTYNESLVWGNNGKVYRTVNGGHSWDTLLNGLPDKEMSRIGLTLVNDEFNTIIAQYINPTYETEALYVSNNMGNDWDKLSARGLSGSALGGFGWYFGKIRSNPFNAEQLYVLGVGLWESNNFGSSFSINQGRLPNGSVHADKHDMAFIDANTFLLATDGGLYKTTDGGESWLDIENIPNTQFYRVAVDHHKQGYYCGGAQDNGTIYGSYTDSVNWQRINGGDGFQVLFDWKNDEFIYSETQNGIVYSGKRIGNNINWSAFIDGITEDNRPWDMPLCMSKINANVLFAGARSVFKNSDAPNSSWKKISHDITDGTNPSFHFISAIDVSPFTDEIVSAGTSNGYVYVLSDGVWNNVSLELPNRYVSDVFNSYDNKQALFVSNTGYKNGDYVPHVHYSDNLGETWQDISGNLPQLSVNSLHALPNHNDSVIFAATDGGVYHTLNRGESWERTGTGMPIIPVYDLAYDDTAHTLVAATFGRSIQAIKLDAITEKYNNPEVISVNLDNEYLEIYPNPASGFFVIESNTIKSESLFLYNLSGQLLRTVKVLNKQTTVDVSDLKAGVYFVRFSSKQQLIKLIVTR